MTFKEVRDLINEPDRLCYATISEKGMTITWSKSEKNSPMEGLFINIGRDKMLELAHKIIAICDKGKVPFGITTYGNIGYQCPYCRAEYSVGCLPDDKTCVFCHKDMRVKE